IRGVPLEELQPLDVDLARGQLHGLAGAGHRVGATAADLDRGVRGRLLQLRAEERGQCRFERLPNRRRALGGGQLAVEVVGRRAGTEAHGGAIGLVVAEVVLDEARRATEEQRQHAGCERIERAAVADPARSAEATDERDDVVRRRSGGLLDHEDPVHSRRVRLPRHLRPQACAGRETASARRSASARKRARASASGAWIVAPAARACPPPPNAPVRAVASTPPGLVLTETRVESGPASLNRIATSAVSDCASRSMSPSEWADWVPVASRSPSVRHLWITRPPSVTSSRSSTRPKSRSCASGLDRYRRREISDSGAPAATSAAETARVRGVEFGWANVEVSITMPAISAAAMAPFPASSGTPSFAASSTTSSQVAAAAGSTQSRGPPSVFEAWWSTSTRGRRSNSAWWRWSTPPSRSSAPQSHTTSRS